MTQNSQWKFKCQILSIQPRPFHHAILHKRSRRHVVWNTKYMRMKKIHSRHRIILLHHEPKSVSKTRSETYRLL